MVKRKHLVDADTLAKAHLLINCVENELRLGTKHFDKFERPLTTVKEIIQTMLDEGKVTLEPTPDRQQYFKEICAKYAVASM